jgi:hypothetical protein
MRQSLDVFSLLNHGRTLLLVALNRRVYVCAGKQGANRSNTANSLALERADQQPPPSEQRLIHVFPIPFRRRECSSPRDVLKLLLYYAVSTDNSTSAGHFIARTIRRTLSLAPSFLQWLCCVDAM